MPEPTSAAAQPGTEQVLASRYARPRRPRMTARGWWTVLGAATLVAALLIAWIVVGQSSRPSSKDVGFDLISSARVTADFEVTKDPDRTVRCGVEAMNEAWAVVGYTETEIGPVPPEQRSGRTSAHRVGIRTTNLATTAQVADCWYVD